MQSRWPRGATWRHVARAVIAEDSTVFLWWRPFVSDDSTTPLLLIVYSEQEEIEVEKRKKEKKKRNNKKKKKQKRRRRRGSKRRRRKRKMMKMKSRKIGAVISNLNQLKLLELSWQVTFWVTINDLRFFLNKVLEKKTSLKWNLTLKRVSINFERAKW